MKEKFKEHINEKFKYIPNNPGIYFMKDEKENIIYIGKAISANLLKTLKQPLLWNI